MSVIPTITGISELQRKGKKALTPVLSGNEPVIFLADRNELFAVVLSLAEYQKLVEEKNASNAWSQAQESAVDFWNNPSDTIYDTLS